MESETEMIQNTIDKINLMNLKIILKNKFNINYTKNIYDFFELFKIRALNQEIYENKFFNTYKKLYSLRNIYIQSSMLKYKEKLKFTLFQYWNIKAHIEKIKYDKNYAISLYKTKRRNSLIIIVLNGKIKNEKVMINIPIIKRYLLLYLKYYNYLIDIYYIKSITIVKAIFNYFRKKLKLYKAIFFSSIDYNIKKEESVYIYKFILTNYINNNTNNINNNKREEAILLLNNYNNDIKLDFNKYINVFNKDNIVLTLLDKFVINKFLVNKSLAKLFYIWKQKTLELSFVSKIQSKEILVNDLMYSKMLILILIIKKKIKKYFYYLFCKTDRNNKNKIFRIKLESIYNNILFNILKGINCIQNFTNYKNNRIYNLSIDNKKIIVLKKWKGQKKIICNYDYCNIDIPKINLKILKGFCYFDSIYSSHEYIRISNLIKMMLKQYSNNTISNYIKYKLILFSEIIQNKIINIKRKIIFHLLFEILKKQTEERKYQKNISFLFSIISKIISSQIILDKISFINKLLFHLRNINIEQLHKKKYNFSNFIIKNKIRTKDNKINNKLKAAFILMKYYQKYNIKKHYKLSLKFYFIHWCSLLGIIPEKKINNIEKEEEEEIKAEKNEIKELQKSLKEDKDFQHDLKAKISALDEENNFVNEKIFEITQRVEKCEKCNNLLKSSFIPENKIKTSLSNILKNPKEDEEDNLPNKSRNVVNEKEKDISSSSGINFITGGTDLVPKKPRGYLKNEEISEPDSIQIDDDDNFKNKNNKNEILENTENIKQKIIELKREKDPIVNKLKEEILNLYSELNMDLSLK